LRCGAGGDDPGRARRRPGRRDLRGHPRRWHRGLFQQAADPARRGQGLYAYTRTALQAYAALPPSPLERAEGLEQLRLLEAGHPIAMVEIPMPVGGIWEVNNPEDVAVVSARLP
jgi:CMP-2-keto-3-deoxyoctulosonic acid synthetase